jgi:GT2 family glycosyltransferase
MMAQRLLPYEEIESDCLMMLDDDVSLAPDSAERMLKAMEEYGADCVGADTFKNHEMSVKSKIYAALTNLVFPHADARWAFKIHCNGSFSYINRPVNSFYWSQSCAGPAMVWRKSVYQQLRMSDELWLDEMGFAYGDDMLEAYKVYCNGYKLGVLFDSGIKNLSAASASSAFHRSASYFYTRTKAMFCIWWRSCFIPSKLKLITATAFSLKTVWLLVVMSLAAIVSLKYSILLGYLHGLRDGWRYTHTETFKLLTPYVLPR